MHQQGFDDLQARLDELRGRGMYRTLRRVEGRQGRVLEVEGRRLLNFCSNDYLGLAGDPRVAEAFARGVDRWGVGSGASHLITGHTAAHAELEEALADFTGRPRALLYSSGYAANVGVINALLTRGDQVFQDRLNHASLLDGGWISRADFHWFEHRDYEDLEKRLGASGEPGCRKLVVSDGTFSMDGDLCGIEQAVAAGHQHGAWLMIDDAHGMGVHGHAGVGMVDPARFSTADVPVLVGTLGKAFGTAGAFVAGEQALIETLIQRSRNYVFSTAIPAAVAVATLTSLEIVQREGWRRERLASLIERFRHGVAAAGRYHLLDSQSPIQPIVVGDPAATVALSQRIEQAGCLCTAIRPPTVPEGTSRLRVTLSAVHTDEDVDTLLTVLHA